ncbi:hypothetical protein FRZ67_07040 [Panacibacter ginsenosidivorans]|uniref:M23 family metallopeptidase n=1 Tax=Panacibacter ginsenosidivorans TaxID=1813871 RepID=A0A5B8V6L3_9BACT|nr:hypothetical protein [Panacibacter ginsenosidivorans]QEC67054.1 hypothetical protein FRZ67_07040 [Panacibacter ginsenosidivorans]
MKSLVLFISSLMISIGSFCQNDSDMITLGKVKELPMKNAKAFKTKHPDGAIVDYFPGLYFISKSDSVFSIHDGKINAILELEENHVSVVTVESDSIYYSYHDLNISDLKKGDPIKKGSLIGLAKKEDEKFRLLFVIAYNTGRWFNEEEIWQLIKDE